MLCHHPGCGLDPMTGEPQQHGDGWRVVVVDDSIVVRASVRAVLAAMPEVVVIEALPHLLRVSPSTRIVMASSLTRRGAAVTMAALAAGASD
jgi:two-component system, chemotaxis family, protein-glutamate methylesterase/glutaminase